MKKQILFFYSFISIFFCVQAKAQYSNLQIKELLDKTVKSYIEAGNYSNALSAVNIQDPEDEPERLQNYTAIAQLIQLNITMYRTTRDKAYPRLALVCNECQVVLSSETTCRLRTRHRRAPAGA